MIEERTLNLLFPQYSTLFNPSTSFESEELEYFITHSLPSLISTVQNLESVFLKLQTSHTNLVIKAPPVDTLMQCFVRKVSEKVQKYMGGMDALVQYEENEHFDFLEIRRLVKERLGEIQGEIQEKYVKNKGLNRVSEELIAQSIYRIIEYYNFTKADIHSIASKYIIKSKGILGDVKLLADPSTINQFIGLGSDVKNGIEEFVDKRMRPFLQKRDFLSGKIKDIIKEPENKYSVDSKNILKILLGKEKGRCQREIYNILQSQIKGKSISKEYHQEPIQLNNEMNSIKSQFSKLKSSSYYLQIIRGTFKLTFGTESNSLQNLFGVSKLEEYLLSCVKLTGRMTELLRNLIEYRKGVNGEVGSVLEDVMLGSLEALEVRDDVSLEMLVLDEFSRLRELLMTDSVGVEESDNRFKEERAERQEERRRRVEEDRERRVREAEKKREEIQEKAERDRRAREEKKQLDEENRLRLRDQMKQKDEVRRREEAERAQKYKKEKLRLDEQKTLREESRKVAELQRKQKLQQQKQQRDREREEKNREREKKSEDDKKRQGEIEAKNREAENERKRKVAEEKAREQERLDEKKRLDEAQKREEKERQEKKKADEALALRQKGEEQERKRELVRKEEEKREEEKRLKRKEEEDLKSRQVAEEKERRLREEREEKQRKDEEERERVRVKEQKERREKQERQRERERQRQQKQREDREQKKRKEDERIRLQNDRKEKQRRDQEERVRVENEKKQNERKQRERVEKERVEREAEDKRVEEENRKKKEKQEQEEREREKERERERERQREQKEREQREREQREKELREQQQQQQRLRKQKQQKQAQRKREQQLAQKEKKKQKQSNFNYDDMYDQDFQPQEQSLSGIKDPSPVKKPAKEKDGDFQFLDDDVDFGEDGEPEEPGELGDPEDEYDEGTQPQGMISPKQLTTPQNLNLFNNSIKSTQYMRKNKPNIYMFNNMKHFTTIFQQMIQNSEMFVFSDVISSALLEVTDKLVKGEAGFEDDLGPIAEFILEEYNNTLSVEEFDIYTKYFFIFKDPNDLGLVAVQFEMPRESNEEIELPRLIFFLNKEANGDKKNHLIGFAKAVCMTFDIEVGETQEEFPEMNVVTIPKESMEVLNSMEEYLPPLLILFNWMYEYRDQKKTILIDQYTVQRFFYCSHALTTIYPVIEQTQEQLFEFYDKLYNKFHTDKDVQTHRFSHRTTDNQPLMKIVQDFRSSANKFSKQKTIGSHLLLTLTMVNVDRQGQEVGNISLYISMSRQPTPNIKFYILGPDMQAQDFLETVYESIAAECKKELEGFEVDVYSDFTRHNGLYTYVVWSLPVWAQLVTKRKISPEDALAVLNFSMLPLISVYKGQD